ncbi:HugZ family protein [Aestuariirhabdus litorea]|uniref:Heme utilization protein HutZ n=1 Tax=Aestuariirhabdus litorea TaxID=2528527 RepID=A0A3P3VI38_9GAMM|nr:pyridoxamine 5'-phosphate oxidase family protein [Aestuariirhabdus litorea]RRJ82390.1 heme utilization protein HutZ [Aestuariirhabdus litorea]RWW92553.1 heme utilization protein HutZ [Endozoicomonadaceae bacterium GTF-13]
MTDNHKPKGEELPPSAQFKAFLQTRNSLMLATLDSDGMPLASYAPCYCDQESFFVFLSELAPHTAPLLKGGALSILLIEDEAQCNNPFRRVRLSCQARVQPIVRESEHWAPLIAQLQQRLGKTVQLLKQLGDFHLFRITPTHGTFVSGFGHAYRVQGLDSQSLEAISGR